MSRFDELKTNFEFVLKEEGVLAAANRMAVHAGGLIKKGKPRDESSDFVDVLFINGCDFWVVSRK